MKKKVFLIALVVCLIGVASVGTLAWFSGSDSISGKFYVADSNVTNPNEIFSVTVLGKENAEYKDLLPGHKVENLTRVKNTGRYTQWVRVKITFSAGAAWQTVLGSTAISSMLDVGAGWTVGGTLTENDTVTFVYYLNSPLESGKTADVYQNLTIPTDLTLAQAMTIGAFSVDVTAEAVQYDNLNAENARKAFDIVGWAENRSAIG